MEKERKIRVNLMRLLTSFAGNFTVKTKRKSNLEIYHFILCFTISAFYYIILFETPQFRLDFDRHKKRVNEYILEVNH